MEKTANLSDFKEKRDQELLREILIRGLRSLGKSVRVIPEGIEVETSNRPGIIKIGFLEVSD